MSIKKEYMFISETLNKLFENWSKRVMASGNKMLKSKKYSEMHLLYHALRGILIRDAYRYFKELGQWEEKSFSELGGLSPRQYFESLNSLNDILELVSVLEEKNWGILPTELRTRIKRLDDKSSEELLKALESIQLGEDKSLNSRQRAIVRAASILANSSFLDALVRIAHQMDAEKTDDRTVRLLVDAIANIGQPALEPLISLLEKSEGKGRLYESSIEAIAEVASENKSERVYRLLKDCFLKSETKIVEAGALAEYGDGRAIPAIRGYVERDLENLPYEKYMEFRSAIIKLGGYTRDLDRHYREFDELDEDEEYYDE